MDARGATFIHPFEDPLVIAGQGTIGLAEQVADAETVVIPVGGGGLASGIAIALRDLRPDLRIVGVQAGLSASRSIADGVLKKPGDLTMSILDDVLDDLVDIDDEAISEAIVLLLERAKLVVEGAGAVGVAALLAGKVGGSSGPVAIVLSGGSTKRSDLGHAHGLTVGGATSSSAPACRIGPPVKLLTLIAEERVNVMSVEHHREGWTPVAQTEIELTLLTRDQEHVAVLLVRWPPGATRSSASSRGRKILDSTGVSA